MKLEFFPKAFEDFKRIKEVDPNLAASIKKVIVDALSHPQTGIGEPVQLEGKLEGLWQRKISFNEYLVYLFDASRLLIVAIISEISENYNKKVSLSIESFSQEDYESVMNLMASNRGKDSEPKVGLFWYNRTTNSLFGVVSHRVSDYTKANASNGRITCSEMHEDVWKKEFRKQKYHNDGQGPFIGAYQDKPRGRIFYNIESDTYEVAVGKWIEEYPQAYDLIIQEFNLPAEKTKAMYAIHWDIGMSWR